MEQKQIIALGCEVAGLIFLLIIPRLLPGPLILAAIVIGFILLIAGMVVALSGRKRRK